MNKLLSVFLKISDVLKLSQGKFNTQVPVANLPLRVVFYEPLGKKKSGKTRTLLIVQSIQYCLLFNKTT